MTQNEIFSKYGDQMQGLLAFITSRGLIWNEETAEDIMKDWLKHGLEFQKYAEDNKEEVFATFKSFLGY